MTTIKQRLAALRETMRNNGLAAYFVPSADPHNSEYVADYWQGRHWLSGFTGSAGALMVTLDDAGLWTDGRYFIQAEEQLQGSGIRLFKMGLDGVPDWAQWLGQVLPAGSQVGFDGQVVTVQQAQAFVEQGLTIQPEQDLLTLIWPDRPPLPQGPAFAHELRYTGLSCAEKLQQLRERMRQQGADYQLLTSLDDIAWLFNIRGTDVTYCPVVLAYALVGLERAWLFIDDHKVPTELAQNLTAQGVTLAPYRDCGAQLARLPAQAVVRLDPAVVNIALYQCLPEPVKVQAGQQLTTAMKAVKNPVEIEHFKACLRQDGVAMVRFMRWLEAQVPSGTVTELSAEAELDRLRQAIPGYQQNSFRTIAGYRAHGAKMHYAATPESDVTIGQESFFLVDSGGQFLDGTTDITRTFNYGALSEQERRDYTLVLKGHIALSRARFKQGCRGTQIDALARAPLWEQGIDYGCGTGHGVGFFLNVHEGPHSLSQKWIDEPLLPGMLVTIEPGIYREGRYGVRIENMLVVVEDQTTEFGTFYRFEPLTLAPINTRPVIKSLLSDAEIAWLNDYHRQVYEALAPLLEADEQAWLAAQTRPL